MTPELQAAIQELLELTGATSLDELLDAILAP